MFKELARLLARWYTKLKHWHAVWHVGTFIGTLARKNEKLVLFWHVGTQAPRHVNHAYTQARWHVDHVGTQAQMAHNLANSIRKIRLISKFLTSQLG